MMSVTMYEPEGNSLAKAEGLDPVKHAEDPPLLPVPGSSFSAVFCNLKKKIGNIDVTVFFCFVFFNQGSCLGKSCPFGLLCVSFLNVSNNKRTIGPNRFPEPRNLNMIFTFWTFVSAMNLLIGLRNKVIVSK